MRGRLRSARGTAVALAALACAALAPSASAYIYWANPSGESAQLGSIARADNDGSNVDLDWIPNLNDPRGVAVDEEHIYWVNRSTQSIGRANLDGTGVNVAFIPNAGGPDAPVGGIALDAAHIWWTNFGDSVGDSGSIGRANLDGSGVNPTYFTGSTLSRSPFGIAVGGPDVFWANTRINGGPGTPAIGRSGLDGTPPPNGTFIDFGGSSGLLPLLLTADSSRLYYVVAYSGFPFAVGSVTLEGANSQIVAQTSASGGLDVHGGTLYIANGAESTISRMNPDGTDSDYAFIRKVGSPAGLAVDGLSTPPGELTVGKLTRNKRKGTAKLAVTVNGAGAVSVAGDGLKPATVQAPGAGEVEVPIKATGSKRKALKRKGKVKVQPELTFTPAQGTPDSESTKLKLKRK